MFRARLTIIANAYDVPLHCEHRLTVTKLDVWDTVKLLTLSTVSCTFAKPVCQLIDNEILGFSQKHLKPGGRVHTLTLAQPTNLNI